MLTLHCHFRIQVIAANVKSSGLKSQIVRCI